MAKKKKKSVTGIFYQFRIFSALLPGVSLPDATFTPQNSLVPGLCACCISEVDIDIFGPGVWPVLHAGIHGKVGVPSDSLVTGTIICLLLWHPLIATTRSTGSSCLLVSLFVSANFHHLSLAEEIQILFHTPWRTPAGHWLVWRALFDHSALQWLFCYFLASLVALQLACYVLQQTGIRVLPL